jgi:hypothetical protein
MIIVPFQPSYTSALGQTSRKIYSYIVIWLLTRVRCFDFISCVWIEKHANVCLPPWSKPKTSSLHAKDTYPAPPSHEQTSNSPTNLVSLPCFAIINQWQTKKRFNSPDASLVTRFCLVPLPLCLPWVCPRFEDSTPTHTHHPRTPHVRYCGENQPTQGWMAKRYERSNTTSAGMTGIEWMR